MAEPNNPNGGATPQEGAEPQMPVIQIVSQYIKDLSFENPSLGVNVQRPQIEFTVDLQARRIQENGPFEVVLKMRVSAQQEEKTIFLLEIAYGGLFMLDKVPDEVMQPLLLIECPRLLFPYVRRIVSDLVSDGGLAPDDRTDRFRRALSQQNDGSAGSAAGNAAHGLKRFSIKLNRKPL